MIITIASCNRPPETTSHEAQWSSDGKDSVVYVHYRNDNGSFTDFYMNHLLFNMLFNQGGYGSVYNHYHTYPQTYAAPSQTAYRNYSNENSPTYKASKSYSSPSSSRPVGSSSSSKSYSSPSSSSSSSSKSYSSPSSSSSSRSYSSPSSSSSYKSYSSPSSSSSGRSYSSPSSRH